jgi:hypothetical protein
MQIMRELIVDKAANTTVKLGMQIVLLDNQADEYIYPCYKMLLNVVTNC